MRRVQTTGVGAEQRKALSTAQAFHFLRDIGTVSPSYSDGTAVVDFPVGAYTYAGILMHLTSTAEIAGKTIERNGKHYVKTANLPEFISKVKLEINGRIVRDFPTDLLIKLNKHRGHDPVNGMLYMAFGGPHLFPANSTQVEDAYMLGTQNLRDVRILFDLTSDFQNNTMFLGTLADYVSRSRPCMFLTTVKSYRHTATAAGEYSITDLPVHENLGAVHFLGDGINAIELEIDGREVYKAHAYEMLAANNIHYRDYGTLGNGISCDFLRAGDVRKGLAALDRPEQVKRNARMRATLDMEAAGEILVVVESIGQFDPS